MWLIFEELITGCNFWFQVDELCTILLFFFYEETGFQCVLTSYRLEIYRRSLVCRLHCGRLCHMQRASQQTPEACAFARAKVRIR